MFRPYPHDSAIRNSIIFSASFMERRNREICYIYWFKTCFSTFLRWQLKTFNTFKIQMFKFLCALLYILLIKYLHMMVILFVCYLLFIFHFIYFTAKLDDSSNRIGGHIFNPEQSIIFWFVLTKYIHITIGYKDFVFSLCEKSPIHVFPLAYTSN